MSAARLGRRVRGSFHARKCWRRTPAKQHHQHHHSRQHQKPRMKKFWVLDSLSSSRWAMAEGPVKFFTIVPHPRISSSRWP